MKETLQCGDGTKGRWRRKELLVANGFDSGLASINVTSRQLTVRLIRTNFFSIATYDYSSIIRIQREYKQNVCQIIWQPYRRSSVPIFGLFVKIYCCIYERKSRDLERFNHRVALLVITGASLRLTRFSLPRNQNSLSLSLGLRFRVHQR